MSFCGCGDDECPRCFPARRFALPEPEYDPMDDDGPDWIEGDDERGCPGDGPLPEYITRGEPR